MPIHVSPTIRRVAAVSPIITATIITPLTDKDYQNKNLKKSSQSTTSFHSCSPGGALFFRSVRRMWCHYFCQSSSTLHPATMASMSRDGFSCHVKFTWHKVDNYPTPPVLYLSGGYNYNHGVPVPVPVTDLESILPKNLELPESAKLTSYMSPLSPQSTHPCGHFCQEAFLKV